MCTARTTRWITDTLAPAGLVLLLSGCMGAPTPLAPGLKGSVGMPHYGVLTGAEELPVTGTGYRRYRPRGVNYWGNPRLVRTIEDVAQSVHEKRPGGAPLMVGDLSNRYGGKIPRHNSHRTGRDVDLLFFMTDPGGAPVRSPGFVRLGADGLAEVSGEYLRLDVERQWLLFKELLTSDRIEVQWLFISRDLEALIIDYALAREADLDLVWHAETVMLQPGDSAPHDDHVHLRVACTPTETVYGCEGGGPRWQWLSPLPELEEPLPELLTWITEEDPPELVKTSFLDGSF